MTGFIAFLAGVLEATAPSSGMPAGLSHAAGCFFFVEP